MHWMLGDQQRGEDFCIWGESGTDPTQAGRLPQVIVLFISKGICVLAVLTIGPHRGKFPCFG